MILEKSINLSLKDISSLIKTILKKLESHNIDEDSLFGIKLSLEEALVNAIKHGNKMDKNKSVSLKLVLDSEKLEIQIKDQGQGFNHKYLSLPTTKKNLEKPSQRGVFLIRKFMDRVNFYDGGSRIKMIKYLNQKEA